MFLLSGCASEGHFLADSFWPFGNPNAPQTDSETAQRALGKAPTIMPMKAQAGDVWPGPVQPMPTLGDIEKNANLPLGQGYTPSLPSPYPPGEAPPDNSASVPTTTDGSLYSISPDGMPAVVPAVPGDAR